MSAAAGWLDRGERSLSDLVSDFRPAQHLRLAVAAGADLGFDLPVRRVLADAFENDELGAGDRRRILRALVNERQRELLGIEKDRRTRPGAFTGGIERHEPSPGAWMAPYVGPRGSHSDACGCARCRPTPEDDAWIVDALLSGLDEPPDRG